MNQLPLQGAGVVGIQPGSQSSDGTTWQQDGEDSPSVSRVSVSAWSTVGCNEGRETRD